MQLIGARCLRFYRAVFCLVEMLARGLGLTSQRGEYPEVILQELNFIIIDMVLRSGFEPTLRLFKVSGGHVKVTNIVRLRRRAGWRNDESYLRKEFDIFN